jgi:hypothetical protein
MRRASARLLFSGARVHPRARAPRTEVGVAVRASRSSCEAWKRRTPRPPPDLAAIVARRNPIPTNRRAKHDAARFKDCAT